MFRRRAMYRSGATRYADLFVSTKWNTCPEGAVPTLTKSTARRVDRDVRRAFTA